MLHTAIGSSTLKPESLHHLHSIPISPLERVFLPQIWQCMPKIIKTIPRKTFDEIKQIIPPVSKYSGNAESTEGGLWKLYLNIIYFFKCPTIDV